MATYILIDNASGYIWGDTTGLRAWDGSMTPIDAARMIDQLIGDHADQYEEVSRHELASNETGFHVYRNDVNGSEAVYLGDYDGQSQEMIDAVARDCEYVTSIRCIRSAD